MFFKGKPEETYNLVKEAFVTGIENIGKAMVRNEFKLWMYSNCLLPSKRFLLTIHTLTDTQLKSLDTSQTKPSKVGQASLQVKPMLSYTCLKDWMLKAYQNCTRKFTQSVTQGPD